MLIDFLLIIVLPLKKAMPYLLTLKHIVPNYNLNTNLSSMFLRLIFCIFLINVCNKCLKCLQYLFF